MEFLDTKLMMAGPVKQFGEFDGFFVKKIHDNAFLFMRTYHFGLF